MRELIERLEEEASGTENPYVSPPENITESRMGKKAHDGYAEAKNLLVSVLRSAPTLFKKHKNVEAASVSGNSVTVQLVSHEPVVITYQLKAYARAKSGAALHMKSGASKIAFDFPSQAVASWTLPDMVASLFTDFAKKHAVRIPLPKNVAPRPKLRAPKPAPKPAAPALTPGEVTSFLKRLTTRTGGRNRDVYFNDDPKWPSWSAEPQRRQRLDHFGNDGDGWDEDGWDDEYAGPLQKEVQKAIDQKFGKGVLEIAVGEKGHIDVQPTAKGKRLIERIESLTESQIAKTIMQQMGGRRAMMMIGAKNLTALDRGLAFSWPNRQRSRGNYVEITLTGRDDYDMEFFNVSKKGKKSVKRFPGLYFDQLVPTFEGHTGWYMSM